VNPSDKLSKLQKFILSEALEGYYLREEMALRQEAKERRLTLAKDPAELEQVYNPRTGTLYLHLDLDSLRDPRCWPHLHAKWILLTYFGFSTKDTPQKVINRRRQEKPYNAATASLYRAIRRLAARGLIRRLPGPGSPLQLTALGISIAQGLGAKEFNQ
jgi:hypothetical protein